MTSEQKTKLKYPEAHTVHVRALGITIYAIRVRYYGRMAIGDGFSASKAWVDAAKNIAAGREPYKLD